MIWTFLVSLAAFAILMLILSLGLLLGRRKRECSCKAAARVMAAKTASRSGNTPDDESDSPFKILDNDSDGCQCDGH